jgi:succinoglycan biosynthesis transport protein ExoP
LDGYRVMNAQLSQIQVSHLRDYWGVLEKRWWLILLAVVVTVGSTAVYLVKTPRQYEATAVVEIPTSGGGGLASAFGALMSSGPSSDVATEIEIITGRNIAEKVIKDLELDKKEKNLELDWREIVSAFRKKLNVGQVGKANLMKVTATGDSPEEARDIANEVADEYVQLSNTSSQKLWSGMINQMETKLEQTKAALEGTRQSLHNYEAKEGITTAFSPLLIGSGASQGGTQYAFPEVPQAVAQLKASIMEMEVQLEVMRKNFSEADPKVISLKKQITAGNQKLQQEEKKVIGKYNKQFGLTGVASEIVFDQQLYSMLASKQEELKAQYIMQNKPPEIMEKAVEPLYPSKPERKLTLMLGTVLGLFLGIGFAFFLEYFENTIRTPDDVTQYLGFPVLGVIPHDKEAKKSKTPIIMMNKRAKRSSAEAYRGLRTSLLAHVGNSIKTITNLGTALAQMEKNVLLIDADLRRPSLHRVFNVERREGLSAVLAGESTLNEVVIKALDPNLLTSGTLPSDTSEALGSDQMKDLIKQAKEQYDLVLFDAAPTLGMADSLVLASQTDGTILVVKTGRATRRMLKIMVSQLEEVGANILGVVLNDVNVKGDRYYSDYYYYYYNYYSPYKDEEGNQIERRKRHKSKRA